MTAPFLAEIRIFPYTFAPKNWAFCNGYVLPISQNTALFALLGTTYGGDGHTTFALPDLRGRVPLHPGQGPGPSLYQLGETGGADTVTLTESQIPAHSHTAQASSRPGDQAAPGPGVTWAAAGADRGGREAMYAPAGGGSAALNAGAIGEAGGGQPHNNLPPYLTFNFCIALQGLFPAHP